MWGQPPSAVRPSKARLDFDFRRPTTEIASTSISLPPAHPPKSPPAQAFRLRAKRPRSCRSIPCRAVCAEQDSLRSQLCVQPKFPAHRLRRFQPALAALRFQYQFPIAEACQLSVLALRLSPNPRAIRSWRNRRSKFCRSPRELLLAAPSICSGRLQLLARRRCSRRLRSRRTSLLLFHLLHPFNGALVGARKHGLHLAQLRAKGSCPQANSSRASFLMSPSPICVQIFAVASGITGWDSAVAIRRASAAV